MTIRSKNPVRILGLLFAFGLLLVMITGCGTSKTIMINSEPPIPVPVDVRENLHPITISNVISAMPVDQEIGGSFRGLLNLRDDTYYAGSKISEAHALILTSLEEELVTAGYQITQSKSTLFGKDTEETSLNKMMIGGEVMDCSYSSYNKIGQVNSEAIVSVAWSLFDPRLDEVIFALETNGEAKGPKENISSLAYAVRASFREFLNDPKFIEAVKK